VQTVDFVFALLPFKGPRHLFRIFSRLLRPSAPLKVEDCRLHRQHGVDDKSEDCFILPVDRDIRRDVVTKGQLGRQLPLVLPEAVHLAAPVLATTKHEQALALRATQEARRRPHRVLAQERKRLGRFELPPVIKGD